MTSLADICECGHYIGDHDGFGCTRRGCACNTNYRKFTRQENDK